MTVVILLRHGESEWNAQGLLTGWSDPPLSDRGEEQAHQAGAALAAAPLTIHRVYTSLLGRAMQTAKIVMDASAPYPAPAVTDWRLNERHLGRLQGLTKAQVIAIWGNEWRKRWRDDDSCRPPPLEPSDPRHPRQDPRYRHVPLHRLPGAERGQETASRVLDFWHQQLLPEVRAGHNVMVVSHLGPLRVLARHLGGVRSPGGAPVAHWPHARLLARPLTAASCCPAGAGTPPG